MHIPQKFIFTVTYVLFTLLLQHTSTRADHIFGLATADDFVGVSAVPCRRHITGRRTTLYLIYKGKYPWNSALALSSN